MRKKVAAISLLAALALALPASASASFWAGNSGHFKGSATPCKAGAVGNPHCPPFG
jgi:hypothetical protein